MRRLTCTHASVGSYKFTENENNINYYNVEHSIDGINFTPVTSQLPTANNFSNPQYSYLHATATAGNNWYRVKATTIAGAAQYTDIVKLAPVVIVEKPSISIYPNPVVDGTMNIYFKNKQLGRYDLRIINNAGQVIHAETVNLPSTNFTKSIKLNVATGSYQITIVDTGGKTISIPFVAQ